MNLFVLVGIAAVAVALIILVLVLEQKDKEYREENGLPRKRYHDITDYDVYTVYTISYRHDHDKK